MNIKVNKYFLFFSILIIILFILNFFMLDKRNINNLYISKIEEIFKDLNDVENMFKSDVQMYFNTNTLSKYSIKEIRDGYTNIKKEVKDVINEIDKGGYEHGLNKRYLLYMLNDILSIIDNTFLQDNIFISNNEVVIKNIQDITDKLRRIMEKYNVFKFNFGLSNN